MTHYRIYRSRLTLKISIDTFFLKYLLKFKYRKGTYLLIFSIFFLLKQNSKYWKGTCIKSMEFDFSAVAVLSRQLFFFGICNFPLQDGGQDQCTTVNP